MRHEAVTGSTDHVPVAVAVAVVPASRARGEAGLTADVLKRMLPRRSWPVPGGDNPIERQMEIVPAFEVIGPRFRFDSAAHMRQVVNGYRIDPRFDGLADGNASGGYVVGAARKDWQALDFPRMQVTMNAGEERLVDTVGGHPLVDPFMSMFPLVNLMRGREGLKAGMLLATHSYSGFIPVPANVKVVSRFTYFDPIEAVFEGG